MKNYAEQIRPFSDIINEFEFVYGVVSVETQRLISNRLNSGQPPEAGDFFTKYAIDQAPSAIKKVLETELNRKFVLELTAAFEAKTVYYFRYICKRRSSFFKAYRNESNVPRAVRNGIKHMMYQHMILIFKEAVYPVDNIVYSQFKHLIEYRNWLAHGKGWELPDHLNKFDFQYSWQVISALFNLIPDYPEYLKN